MKNMTAEQMIKKLVEERDHALATVESQQKEIDKLTAELEKHRWIPCSEHQPTENGNYLVVVRSWDETATIDFMDVDHCNFDGYWLHYHDSANKKTGRRAIAWMPLPKAYKDGE